MEFDLGHIRAHMKVVGLDRQPVGTIDHIEDGRIKLARHDPLADGQHHYIPVDWVGQIEGDVVRLRKSADDARREWQPA